MAFKLEPFIGTYEDDIVATGKTLAELKEKLTHIQVSNIYPSYDIYEVKFKKIDHCFIPRA